MNVTFSPIPFQGETQVIKTHFAFLGQYDRINIVIYEKLGLLCTDKKTCLLFLGEEKIQSIQLLYLHNNILYVERLMNQNRRKFLVVRFSSCFLSCRALVFQRIPGLICSGLLEYLNF